MNTQYWASINVLKIPYIELMYASNSNAMDSYGDKCSPACQDMGRADEPIYLVLPVKMRKMIMSYALSDVVNSLPAIFVHGKNDLKFIDFSSNEFKKLDGKIMFTDSIPLMSHWISVLTIVNVYMLTTGNIVGIASLYLPWITTTLLARHGNSSFLQWLTQLVELNLIRNNIKDLPRSTFSRQNNLQRLLLADNSLIYINFEVSHINNLTYLDLSGIIHTADRHCI